MVLMRLIVLLFGGLLAVPGVAAAQSFAPLTGASGCVVAEGAETDSESGTARVREGQGARQRQQDRRLP